MRPVGVTAAGWLGSEGRAATDPEGMYGATGPAWTRGEMEAPAGEKDMGGWVAAVYTAEQQARLGVEEDGSPMNRAGPAAADYREQFTVVRDGGQPVNRAGPAAAEYREQFTVVRDGGQPVTSQPPAQYNRVAAAKAKKAAQARRHWKVAGTVAKTVVSLPMAIGIPVQHVPPDAVWADSVQVPTAIAITDDGQLELTDADKIELLKKKLAAVPPSVFATLDANHDGFLDKEELRHGFESMGETLTDPELATIVAMADTDKDGKVSCEEFELLATTLAEVAALKAELGVA